MKLEPQILRHAYDGLALNAAITEILIGMAIVVGLCTAMAALSELRRGISAAVGWLALALVGAVIAAAFAVHAAMPAGACASRFSGVASYYSNGESGSRTASGARFDDRLPTAAHRCLPFGTRLRVTRGDRSVIVTVNDRGPAAWTGRVLDLARAPAFALGLAGPGVARVVAEVVD